MTGPGSLVTGAARGIGRAVAVRLATRGDIVFLADRDVDEARRAARRITDGGMRARAVALDVTDIDQVREVIAEIDERTPLGTVVNNAGICPLQPIDEVDVEGFDRIVAVNLRGVFFLSQAAARHMRARRCGRIINISSVGGRTGGNAGIPVYAATKAGLFSLTKSFANYLAPHGTVNCIAPGPTESALTAAWDDPQLMARLRAETPLQRLGQPADYGGVAVFLASEAANFITGATIDVNGGFHMD